MAVPVRRGENRPGRTRAVAAAHGIPEVLQKPAPRDAGILRTEATDVTLRLARHVPAARQ